MNTILDALMRNLNRRSGDMIRDVITRDDTISPDGYEIHDDKSVTLFVDIPGCSRENIQIETDKNRVFLRAERTVGEQVIKYAENYSFNSKYDVANAAVKYEDGVLKLTVPAAAPEQPTKRKLEIG